MVRPQQKRKAPGWWRTTSSENSENSENTKTSTSTNRRTKKSKHGDDGAATQSAPKRTCTKRGGAKKKQESTSTPARDREATKKASPQQKGAMVLRSDKEAGSAKNSPKKKRASTARSAKERSAKKGKARMETSEPPPRNKGPPRASLEKEGATSGKDGARAVIAGNEPNSEHDISGAKSKGTSEKEAANAVSSEKDGTKDQAKDGLALLAQAASTANSRKDGARAVIAGNEPNSEHGISGAKSSGTSEKEATSAASSEKDGTKDRAKDGAKVGLTQAATSEKEVASATSSEKEATSVETSNNALAMLRKAPTVLLTHQGMTSDEFCRWCPKMQDEIRKGKVIVKSPQLDAIRSRMNRNLEESDCLPEWTLGICVTCRDGKGTSDGVIKLRTPFYGYYYLVQHCEGAKHRAAVAHKAFVEDQIKKGKAKRRHQGVMSSFITRKKKKSNPPEAPTAASVEGRALSKKKKQKDHCVSVVNSIYGEKKEDVQLVAKYIIVGNEKSSYNWGTYGGLPAIVSKSCTGTGIKQAVDGGLACMACTNLRSKKGSSNPLHVIRNWTRRINRAISRRTRGELTKDDITDAEDFLKIGDRYLTEEGKQLKAEALAQSKYAKRMRTLATLLPSGSFKLAASDAVQGSGSFLLKAHELYMSNADFRNSIVVSMLEGLVVQLNTGVNNHKIEERVRNFYRYLATISPTASQAVAANLGRSPSKRWMQVLNARERTTCVYDINKDEMERRMLNAVKRRMVDGKRISYSVSLDATKSPKVLEVSSAHRAIMGGCYPNHKLSTVDLTADAINAILEQKKGCKVEVSKASEIKVAMMTFQQTPRGVSPVEIVAARPQSTNEASSFTGDVCSSANVIAKKVGSGSFINFAVDGVGLESNDVMTSLCRFLAGEINYTGTTDNKHNVKNDRYAIIGGSSAPTIGKLVIDVDLLRQAEVSKELIRVKDWASDKKADRLFSYPTLKKVADALEKGKAAAHIADAGALACTFLFLKLHLHAVNGRHVPATHRALYLAMSMLWFTTIKGIHITPRRNFVSESISNTFITLRDDVTKVRDTTTEGLEHGFADARKGPTREFTCSEFSVHVEKQNRRMEMLHQGDLRASKEVQKGYLETFDDWLSHGKINHLDLQGGPCKLVLGDNAAPVSKQLWPYVSKVHSKAVALMTVLFDCVGVNKCDRSPFCKDFDSREDLLSEYVKYCPRTFSFDNIRGEEDDDASDTESDDEDCNQDKGETVAYQIKKFAEALQILTDQSKESAEDSTTDQTSTNKDNSSGNLARVEAGRLVKLHALKSANDDLINKVKALTKCSEPDHLIELALSASAAVNSSERGSSFDCRKAKSLLGRIYEKSEEVAGGGSKGSGSKDTLYLERDALVEMKVKKGRNKNSPVVDVTFRVLGVYDKTYNKWFMAGEKAMWSKSMKDAEKKKYKLKLRMVEKDFEDEFDDVSLNDDTFGRSVMCQMVDASAISDVLTEKFSYNSD